MTGSTELIWGVCACMHVCAQVRAYVCLCVCVQVCAWEVMLLCG